MPAGAERRVRLPVVDGPGRGRWNHQSRDDAPAPKWAIWELTLACDQRCAHCGPRAGKRRPNELTTEEALAVVDELAELGLGEVLLLGGEAYLRGDVAAIVRAIRAHGMRCTMTTGGLNLDEKRARMLVEAGVGSITVSIDGLEDNHDHVRGVPGSWQRAFAALRHVRAAGGKVACNSQINALTIPDLLPLLEHLAVAGVHSWQLQITVPHGNAADHPELIVQPYMFPHLFDVLEQVIERAEELGIRIWPGNNLGYFGPLEQRLRASQRKHFRGCTAGVTSIGIESDGSIKNCPSLGGSLNVGGNVRDRTIREIWADTYQLGYIRRRTRDDLWGFCRDCYYADTCMAGCTAAAEPLLGRPGNNPFCHHRAQELARQGLRERIEQVSGAGGRPFDNGLWRVVREHLDPVRRAATGPVSVDEPRTSRAVDPTGPGRPLVPPPSSAGPPSADATPPGQRSVSPEPGAAVGG